MQNKFFPEIKNKFGFGLMRLPLLDAEDTTAIDIEQMKKMVDLFIERGFNYFDTAHPYHKTCSETAVKAALTSRYSRDQYILTNKLSQPFFETEEEVRPLIESQLEACGVEYFDFLLMHAQNKTNFEKYKKCRAYEIGFELKKEGKVKHVGLSFHDTADVLDNILTTYPEVEVVQLQFNYFDYESDTVQSRKCYEVCEKHGKPVIVMEPIRGGNLIKLPDDAEELVKAAGIGKAELAIRYAASFDNIMMVLSGMHCIEDMDMNTAFMADFKPLSDEEMALAAKVAECIKSKMVVPCTGCRYCVDGCPMQISIPDLFTCLNSNNMFKDWPSKAYYSARTAGKGKASDCVACGQCEGVCPQNLKIIDLLKDVAAAFEQ